MLWRTLGGGIAGAILLAGCAQQPAHIVSGPSSGALHSNITTVQSSVGQAQVQNSHAQELQRRIEAKQMVIDRWNATHHQ